MPNFFSNCWNAISTHTFASTPPHRNTQRTNAVAEIAGSLVEPLNPLLVIPSKVTQTCLSVYTIFRRDVKLGEKGVHLLQGSIAAAQLGLAITLFFNSKTCEDDTETLCKAALFCQLVYKGVLLTGWVPSEVSKAPHEPAPQIPQV
jgi:hypothetical protein